MPEYERHNLAVTAHCLGGSAPSEVRQCNHVSRRVSGTAHRKGN